MSSLKDLASLIMIPSLVKDGRLDTVKPLGNSIIHPDATGNNDGTDGSTPAEGNFTFSRGTNLSATRVNASQLIEKGRENLLTYSNTLNLTNEWTQSLLSGVTGNQSGYDGSNDAWILTPTASSGQHNIRNNSTTPNGVYTFSAYVKAGGIGYAFLQCVDSGGGNFYGYYNLSTGGSSSTNFGGSGTIIQTTTQDVGGGWYRLIMVLNGSGASSARIGIAAGIYGGAHSFSASVTDTIYVQDAQLEQGIVSTSVIETGATTGKAGILENTPRFDYSGGATCPSLLLEPSRTNLLVQSEYFEASYWIKSGGSLTSGFVSPDGTSNAYKFVEDTSTGTHILNKNIGAADGNSYTSSVFAKKGERGYLTLYSGGVFTDSCTFNLENGTSINNGTSTSKIELISNGWYKCSVTSINKSRDVYAMVNNGSSGTSGVVYTGDGTSGVYIYGAQLEQGSYPTSYIPTYGVSQTRAVDVCNQTGATALIGQSEGTLFLDFVVNDSNIFQIIYQVRTTGGTNVGQIDFRIQSGNLRVLGNDGGTAQFNISAGALVAGTRYKCALRYATNDVAFYVNGVLKGSDTNASFSSSTLSQITFNENGSNFYCNSDVKQALLFKTGLTNTELASLTTI